MLNSKVNSNGNLILPKAAFLLFFCFSFQNISAQKASSQTNEPFYVNVFIAADKTIYVETEKTAFEDVNKKVSKIVRERPFKIDQSLIYRIFGDENLLHGYIMDVNREMLSGFSENVQTRKYLLNTMELNIDGNNWFEKIDLDELKGN